RLAHASPPPEGSPALRCPVVALHAPLARAGPRAHPHRRRRAPALDGRAYRRLHRGRAGPEVRARDSRRGARGDGLPPDHGRSRPRAGGDVNEAYRPYTLVAELTYRCPLRCVYCSNPLDYGRHDRELATATGTRVFRAAEDLGVVQLNLTGGEPLVRD